MPETLSCENRNGVGMVRKTSDNERREESRALERKITSAA